MTQATYLSAEQVAATIGVEVEYVRRQCKAGHLKATKLGTKWRIHPADLDAFMRGATVAPARPGRSKKLSARQQRRAS